MSNAPGNSISRLLWAIWILAIASPAPAQWPTTQPFPGVTFNEQIRLDPPMRLYWVQADLRNPKIHLRLCPGTTLTDGPWPTTLLPVSKIARREHLDVAVNGNLFASKYFIILLGRKIPYFAGNPAQVCGWAVSDGRLWSEHPFNLEFPTLVVSHAGDVWMGHFSAAPRTAWQAVSGSGMLLLGGRNVGGNDAPAPHTAAGLDASGHLLTLLVVDGRRPNYSAGMSMRQTAAQMLRLGCWTALALDGGGSTTLVIRHNQQWPVINTPSDGHDFILPLSIERSVADALGIVVDN